MSDIFGHGTNTMYRNHGCRCDACKAAASAYSRQWRLNKLGQPPPKHGEYGYRTYGCRCEVCTAGRATVEARQRRNRRRLVRDVPELITHGASAYSQAMCHCTVCRSDFVARYRSKAHG